jgi:protein glucosyltransferase
LDAAYTPNYKLESGLPGVDPVDPVELEDHCDYRYLINARGVAASFRFKHLFLCESLVFNVGDGDWSAILFYFPDFRTRKCKLPLISAFSIGIPGNKARNDRLEFFYPALKPYIHYIPLNEDLSDAESKLSWAMDPANAETVQGIAKAGFELVRDHLRNEDVKEYWRELLVEYAPLLAWEVERDPRYDQKLPDKEDRRRGLEEMTFSTVPGG